MCMIDRSGDAYLDRAKTDRLRSAVDRTPGQAPAEGDGAREDRYLNGRGRGA